MKPEEYRQLIIKNLDDLLLDRGFRFSNNRWYIKLNGFSIFYQIEITPIVKFFYFHLGFCFDEKKDVPASALSYTNAHAISDLQDLIPFYKPSQIDFANGVDEKDTAKAIDKKISVILMNTKKYVLPIIDQVLKLNNNQEVIGYLRKKKFQIDRALAKKYLTRTEYLLTRKFVAYDKELFTKIRDILNHYDPCDIFTPKRQKLNRYDFECNLIIDRIDKCTTETDIENMVMGLFQEMTRDKIQKRYSKEKCILIARDLSKIYNI